MTKTLEDLTKPENWNCWNCRYGSKYKKEVCLIGGELNDYEVNEKAIEEMNRRVKTNQPANRPRLCEYYSNERTLEKIAQK